MFGFGFGFGSNNPQPQPQSYYPPHEAQPYYSPYGSPGDDFGQGPRAFPPISESSSTWWPNQGPRDFPREDRQPQGYRNRPRERDRYNIRHLIRRAKESPCFRHDHPLLTQHGDLPFHAGDWELDHKHMIEVQFDQFGVASSCKSNFSRGRPWKPDQHLSSTTVATFKLQMEVDRFMERIGLSGEGDNDDYYRGGARAGHRRQDALGRSWDSEFDDGFFDRGRGRGRLGDRMTPRFGSRRDYPIY